MIRFRIFGIFHKHFVWRLLNYNPKREGEKKKASLLNQVSLPQLFFTIHTYIIYIHTYITAHTKYVSTKYSLYNSHVISTERNVHTSYICAKLGFLLGGCIAVKWWGLLGWGSELYFYYGWLHMPVRGTKDRFGPLKYFYFLLKNAGKGSGCDDQGRGLGFQSLAPQTLAF